jgi:DNA-binding response OmpR family regulator
MSSRVLLVEDSASQALRLRLELQRYGVAVDVAATGLDGLNAARTARPHVVVLDVNLPDLDGYTVCRRLKADPETSHIPVVMLTGRDDAQDALAGLEIGAVDYIPKDAFAEYNVIESLRHLGLL